MLQIPKQPNFYENPFSGQRVAICGQTDGPMERHSDDANEFSQKITEISLVLESVVSFLDRVVSG
jgi:hypothetical protein